MKKVFLVLLCLVLALCFFALGCKKTSSPTQSTPGPTATPFTSGTVWGNLTTTSFGGRADFSAVSFNGGIYVYGGLNGSGNVASIYSSTNGSSWQLRKTTADFGARYAHTAVVYNDGTGDKVYVIAGSNGSFLQDVWVSSNGADFSSLTGAAQFGQRIGQTSVVFDVPGTTTSAIWVIGGFNIPAYKDAWYSINGIDWTAATQNAEFGVRYRHTSVVYNNKMWVIAGNGGSGTMADVWYSSNGIAWTQATSNAAFGLRVDHKSFVYDNKMWLVCGSNGTVQNDAWYSTDGATWTQATFNSTPVAVCSPARWYHCALVFNGKAFIMGGADLAISTYYEDVWESN